MKELIEELKNNNYETIRKDYIIERLENINENIYRILDYFEYHNKNLTKAQETKIMLLEEINTKIFRKLL